MGYQRNDLDRYTATADQQTLADDGIASIPSRTEK
jgi:hypothetical protein